MILIVAYQTLTSIFAGQEDETVNYDEGITITPFNMKSELEEGHFDKDGTYIFEKQVHTSKYIIVHFYTQQVVWI